MITQCSDVLLSLYGEPRSVIHARASARGGRDGRTQAEETPLEKIGHAMVNLISLKERSKTAR
ncbi:hypothetical protein [Rhizobium binxianense]